MIGKDQKVSKRQVALVLSDVLVCLGAPVLSLYLYLWLKFGFDVVVVEHDLLTPFALLNVFLFLCMFFLFDLYNFQQDFRTRGVFLKIPAAVIAGAGATIVCAYLLNILPRGRGIFVLYCAVLLLGIALVRMVYSLVGSVGVYDKKILLVGDPQPVGELWASIGSKPGLRLKVLGAVTDAADRQRLAPGGPPVLGTLERLPEIAAETSPDVIILAMDRRRYDALLPALTRCGQKGAEIWDLPGAYERLEKRIPLKYVDDWWLFFAAMQHPKPFVRRIKRFMGIVVSAVLIVLTAPLMLLAAAAVSLECGRPILLTQERIGKDGRLIRIRKFRSMEQCEPCGDEKGFRNPDGRVTRVGRVLRKLHIDELPQLFSVFSGDLNIVGPRAELFTFVDEYIAKPAFPPNGVCLDPVSGAEHGVDPPAHIIPYIEHRFTVRQGITGWAQVMQPYSSSTYADMVEKLEYDLYYIKNMSLFLDFVILMKTVRIVLFGQGK